MRSWLATGAIACSLACASSASAQADGAPRAVREAEQIEASLSAIVDGWNSADLRELAFGLPTAAQRARAAERARENLIKIETARRLLRQLVEHIEASGGLDDPIERETLSRALLIESVAVPLLEARAQLLLALALDVRLGAGPTGAARAAFEAAVSVAGAVESASAWADAERGLIEGVARTALGDAQGARRALNDVDDALNEAPALANVAFGLAEALETAQAVLAFHREADVAEALGAAQRRLREAQHVSSESASALLMRLLVARTGDAENVRARALLTARLDEIARIAMTDPYVEDRVMLDQLSRVARLADAGGTATWQLGPAVGVALALDDVPTTPVRTRAEALTALLEREREAMGPYVVIVLSELAQALSVCAAQGECDFDLAVHLAVRAVEARPIHVGTRMALARLCTLALEHAGPPGPAVLGAVQALALHEADATARDAWRSKAILKAVANSDEDDAQALLNVITDLQPLINALEYEDEASVALVIHLCDQLAHQIALLEQAMLRDHAAANGRMRAQLAALIEELTRRLEGVAADVLLDQARLHRARAMIVAGETAGALELIRELEAPDSIVHFRALLATGDTAGAAALLHGAADRNEHGALLYAALLDTYRLWADGPRLLQQFAAPDSAQLSPDEYRILSAVMRWAVEAAGAFALPEDALRLGLGRLILTDASSAASLAQALASAPAPSASIARERVLLAAEALLRSGDDAGGFALLRDLVAASPPEARQARTYWHASVRIVQVLDRQNDGGVRTPAIIREIQRLRLQPTWGVHTDCAAAIDALAEKHNLSAINGASGP